MSWIKMRHGLERDPKVVRIACVLNAHSDRVIGALYRLWTLADENSVDGDVGGYTRELLDSFVGLSGFAGALEEVGWAEFRARSNDTQTLVIPNFAKHNGSSAKRRSMEAARVARTRDPSVRIVCASDANTMRTREEKRREEKNQDCEPDGSLGVVPASGALPPAARRISASPIALDRDTGRWTGIDDLMPGSTTLTVRAALTELAPGVNIDGELVKASAWVRADYARRKKGNWLKFLTNWLTKAQDQASGIESNGTRHVVHLNGKAALAMSGRHPDGSRIT